MIAEVSAALSALYGPLLPDGVSLRFAPPAGDGASALCFFLASIEEDTQGVPADWADVRDERGRVLGRQPPPRRFDLLYLVTAWAPDGSPDGHRQEALLDVVLAATVPGTRLSQGLLSGDLAGPGVSVLVRLAPQAVRAYADLGLPPRTVLGLTVNAPLILPMSADVAAPAEQITLGVDRARPARPAPAATPPLAPEPRRWRKSRIAEHPPADDSSADDLSAVEHSSSVEQDPPGGEREPAGVPAAGTVPRQQRTAKEGHARRGEAR
ncbi:MAG TPA: Pvc16 family protein [Rugosimonospora sp.]